MSFHGPERKAVELAEDIAGRHSEDPTFQSDESLYQASAHPVGSETQPD
jgi:hypothetical protein